MLQSPDIATEGWFSIETSLGDSVHLESARSFSCHLWAGFGRRMDFTKCAAYPEALASLVLHNHRYKVFFACDFGVMTFSVLVFHMPDIGGANLVTHSIAGRHSDSS